MHRFIHFVFRGLLYWVCFLGVNHGALASEGFELPLDTQAVDREDPNYLTSYAPILKPAKEAVVAVHSASILRYIRQRGMDPRIEMLRRYYGLPTPDREEPEEIERRINEGVGSGVVIAADGYILTNNHVITARDGEPADEILVELNDGRELTAQLVGRDPRSDLAVLKVEADHLPYLPVADSDQLEVGDVVFAIGNPMGVGLTITQGIVSATKRGNLSILGELGYESFIQTDAPINPGNSGGALVDAYGRLVGINTAILSRSGGSIGLGFAIPSTFARSIALALVRDGEVRRGILGIQLKDVNAEYAEAFKVPEGTGVLVESVVEGLPAAVAGLVAGDVIVGINDGAVEDIKDLRIQVAASPPGASVRVQFRRAGVLKELDVVLGDPNDPYGTGTLRATLLEGVSFTRMDAAQRQKYGLSDEIQGLVVDEVAEDSPYVDSLAPGLVFVEINGVVPESIEHGRTLLESRRVSRVYVYYRGHVTYLAIRP
ncbi:trypsin-like peptidase domain-containing protein [Coraliomargarita sp. SDUM461004]|uniref:Trypsin-like peptidase domain-containing protein n=1 Tax=Thalassobacterium sedimentorum TaxID=3041258 RepID=A0ABU1AL65_9BACT|nr:trypsin-like peptidase domain-containing protein [Coraliomargarita sp. SDUM461004]MDQ8194928.1 trypsin-like peptidase domain-containing protein [Coraliomargarita sp. SDUM461004]